MMVSVIFSFIYVYIYIFTSEEKLKFLDKK